MLVFDGIHLFGKQTENGRLVARTRADLEHAVFRGEVEQLGHIGDNVRLRDGLAIADGQRTVLIRRVPQLRGHKLMARHFAHCLQHTLVADAARRQLLIDHAVAGRAEIGNMRTHRPIPATLLWFI